MLPDALEGTCRNFATEEFLEHADAEIGSGFPFQRIQNESVPASALAERDQPVEVSRATEGCVSKIQAARRHRAPPARKSRYAL